MDESVPFTQAKAHLSELFERVQGEHARITVTRHGQPAATLVNPDDLAALEETVEIVQDSELMESVRRSRREASSGERAKLERDQ